MPQAVTILVDVLTERVVGDCPSCGFESIRRSHGYRITPAGVTQVFDVIFCGRCRADERRRSEQADPHS